MDNDNISNIRLFNIIKEKEKDINIRGSDYLVYQNNKIIKLKDAEIKYDKNYKYIKPNSAYYKFWDGFLGWRYLFRHY